jgi:hypothetical protein
MWDYARGNTDPRSNRRLPHPQSERGCLVRLRQQGVVIFRTGCFQSLRNLRNSANRISTLRALSRTLASIHILLAPWSCSLRKTDRGWILWSGASAFYAPGHSGRPFLQTQRLGVHR